MTTELFDILDAHLHAWPTEGIGACFAPRQPATVDERVLEGTLAQMDQLGIRQGVLSGPDNVTAAWCQRAPGRFIPLWYPSVNAPGVGVRAGAPAGHPPPPDPPDPEAEAAAFAEAVDTQGVRGLGELIMQYAGLAVNDASLYPLYRVCAQRHLPVFSHTGLDGPNWPRWAPAFRVELGNPLLFEDVLAAFPDLVVVLCHMSYPFTEQATYMLYAHANVYMDVATVNWILGRAGFHRLLRQVVETVGPDKILFGIDRMSRPEVIPVALSAIQEASFLSAEDRRKILGDNARRLLGIAPA